MKYLFLLIFMFGAQVSAKQLKVAVIDSGLESKYINKANLCLKGHKTFVGTDLDDEIGHGTNVVGLINKYASNADYCIIVIKFIDNSNLKSKNSHKFKQALVYAKSLKPDILNLSIVGKGIAVGERTIITEILDSGIKMVAAAGNDGEDFDKGCHYYPVCYDERIWVVSASDLGVANTGDIVDSYLSGKRKHAFGITMSGSSQATAIFTGKMIRNLSRDSK